jgi:hypothetical protein
LTTGYTADSIHTTLHIDERPKLGSNLGDMSGESKSFHIIKITVKVLVDLMLKDLKPVKTRKCHKWIHKVECSQALQHSVSLIHA